MFNDLAAVLWPVIVFVLLVLYHTEISSLTGRLLSRVTKLEFAGVSIELAKAEVKSFSPDWSVNPGFDLRNKVAAVEISSSSVGMILGLLNADSTADYAEINLGAGNQWLTSRLFIMAILFSQMKGIKSILFLKGADSENKCFAGWTDSNKLRWALAKQFPWLEEAYAKAYAKIMSQPDVLPQSKTVIVSSQGRLGYVNDPNNSGSIQYLLKEFLTEIQITSEPYQPTAPDPQEEWTLLKSNTIPASQTIEHGVYVSSSWLEELLGIDFNKSAISSATLEAESVNQQLRDFLLIPARYIAVTGTGQQFKYLVDRDLLLEQVAKGLSLEIGTQT